MEDLYYRRWAPDAIEDLGFDRGAFDQAHMLVRLIDGIARHAFLGPRLVLKGGAALGLFQHELLRVPLDVDFNCVVAPSHASMAAEQSRFLEPIKQVVARIGMPRAMLVRGDINFLCKSSLWPPQRRDSCAIAGDAARQVVVQDPHDTAAAKLATVIARSSSRDLFDGRAVLRWPDLDPRKLRVGFIVHGVLSLVDLRAARITDIVTGTGDVATLLPMLRRDVRPAPELVDSWTAQLVAETRDAMAGLLAFEPPERKFLHRLYTEGELAPELLTRDPELQDAIANHPSLAARLRAIRHGFGGRGEPPSEDKTMVRFRMHARWGGAADDSDDD